jgi:hypothetical protein
MQSTGEIFGSSSMATILNTNTNPYRFQISKEVVNIDSCTLKIEMCTNRE